MPTTELTRNTYARDWNAYSAAWEDRFGARFRHLGDESSDGRPASTEAEQRLFAHVVAPWITPASRLLEIGPGGGKWTIRLAPLVRELVAIDCADAMVTRTRERARAAEMRNISCVLGNGRDLAPIAADAMDIVFSFDVFVHIGLDDTREYLAEITRVLKDDGVAVIQYAVGEGPGTGTHVERTTDAAGVPRCPHSPPAIEALYACCGLRVDSTWTDGSTLVVTARKPADSLVPQLELALRQAAAATTEAAIDDAARAIEGIGAELHVRLAELGAQLGQAPDADKRAEAVRRIRRLVRG